MTIKSTGSFVGSGSTSTGDSSSSLHRGSELDSAPPEFHEDSEAPFEGHSLTPETMPSGTKRHSSRSESNLSEAEVAGLANFKGKNSDSGISQCSELSPSSQEGAAAAAGTSAEAGAKKERPSGSRRRSSGSRRSSSAEKRVRSTPQTPVKSPRLRRPERLTLAVDVSCENVGHANMPLTLTSVWVCNGPKPQKAALILKNPYTVCTPCFYAAQSVTAQSASTSTAGNPADCRCKRKTRQRDLLDHVLPPSRRS